MQKLEVQHPYSRVSPTANTHSAYSRSNSAELSNSYGFRRLQAEQWAADRHRFVAFCGDCKLQRWCSAGRTLLPLEAVVSLYAYLTLYLRPLGRDSSVYRAPFYAHWR